MNTEYRFGLGNDNRYIVRIKGDAEIELPIGVSHTETVHYPDMNVTHNFKPDEFIKRETDGEGNHYTWYFLSDYYRTIDRVPRVDAELEQINANIAYLSMMTDVDMIPMDDGGMPGEMEM